MTYNLIQHKVQSPGNDVSEFIERFWMVKFTTSQNHQIVVVPDGRVDLTFTIIHNAPFTAKIVGIETEPSQHTLVPGTIVMGVGLKLLAVEYCLKHSIAPMLDKITPVDNTAFGITEKDLGDFNVFCHNIEATFKKLVPKNIDKRKRALFNLLYKTQGSLKIQEYADQCFWPSRQINRYFREWFGLSLKEYCNILRFKASITHIREGQLFPELTYSDQPHFIREVKKFTGVTPKELFKRQNDRYIQVSGRQ